MNTKNVDQLLMLFLHIFSPQLMIDLFVKVQALTKRNLETGRGRSSANR